MQEGETIPEDTDQDGITDEWEKSHNLNPADPTDATTIAENGYSHLENFLETITAKPDPTLPDIEVAITQPEINVSVSMTHGGQLNIKAEEEILRLSLYDVKGALISTSSNNNITLPQDMAIYILKIHFKNGCSATRKLVK